MAYRRTRSRVVARARKRPVRRTTVLARARRARKRPVRRTTYRRTRSY